MVAASKVSRIDRLLARQDFFDRSAEAPEAFGEAWLVQEEAHRPSRRWISAKVPRSRGA
jgi:hypothetical protein